jgi:Alpha-galactosyl-binding fungal lectin
MHKLNPERRLHLAVPATAAFGLGVPDALASTFALMNVAMRPSAPSHWRPLSELRAEVLGVAAASGDTGYEFKCWQKEGRKGDASVARLNENYTKFCDHVRAPDNKVGWKSEVSCNEGTPEEHSFLLQLSSNAGACDKNKCLESLDRIINGCDGNGDKNPMN